MTFMETLHNEPDRLWKLMYEWGDIKSPRLKFDRKNLLIHGFSFDRKTVEDTIKSFTDRYTAGQCTTPSYMVWYEFEDEKEFSLAVVALKLQYS